MTADAAHALSHVPDARRRLREACLYPWTERGPLGHWAPRRLEQVFDLAERVAMLYYAAQFRRSALLIETSWEVRAFAPLSCGASSRATDEDPAIQNRVWLRPDHIRFALRVEGSGGGCMVLEGIRVLDAGSFVAGPAAATVMGRSGCPGGTHRE